MTKHLFGAIITDHGIAANNRGETEGNTTTLQKLLWNGDVHTTISAEAIRWAIRTDWQNRGLPVNRRWDERARGHAWEDRDFQQGGEPYIDDDVLGYMSAQAARQDGNEELGDRPAGRRGRARGTTLVRRSRFEATRAVSLSPWTGDVVFNVASVGATPSASQTGRDPVPYSGEVHATRYQYAFALTPEHLIDRTRAFEVLEAIINLSEVAGNHARFLYDFAPDSVIFRWTDDPAPRMLYAFQLDANGGLAVPQLLRRIRAGDVESRELIVGGSLSEAADGQALHEFGARVYAGVKEAAQEVKQRIAQVIET